MTLKKLTSMTAIVLVSISTVIATIAFAQLGIATPLDMSKSLAEAQSVEKKWYYTTDEPYFESCQDAQNPTRETCDTVHTPRLLDNLQPGEKWEAIFEDATGSGYFIIAVCATLSRHSQLIEDDNKLGSTLENTKEALHIRARFAGLRTALQQKYNERLILGNLPEDLIDPVDLIHEGGPC